MRRGKPVSSSSNSSSRRCIICGCEVPANDQAWQTHTAGIRHRRNQASCVMFGEPGHAVGSVFEADDPPPPTYRGKDTLRLAAQQQAAAASCSSGSYHSRQSGLGRATRCGSSTAPPSSAGHEAQALRDCCLLLQKQLGKQLAHQVGINTTYKRALDRFSLQALEAAWQHVHARIQRQQETRAQQQQQQQQQQQPIACRRPGDQQQQMQAQPGWQVEQQQMMLRHHNQQQQQHQQRDQQHQQPLSLDLDLQEAAQIACLAQLLPPSAVQLKLTVPYHTYGPAAAASSAALACFASSLAQAHTLQQLELVWASTDYSHVLRQGGVGLARLPELWGGVAAALTAAMKVNCGLRRLVLAPYPGQFPPDALAALQRCLTSARAALRLSVLMATHPRCGASSPLHGLPREVLGCVLGWAVPRQAASLVLELPPGLVGDDGDSTDNSTDSSTDSSSDSSDSSSDESDSEESDDSSEGGDG